MDRPSDPHPTMARRPVLYVEDHPVNALLMAALFERRPHLELVVATTGQQALCLATGLHPALLLLDLRLPDCHGGDLLPLLRQIPGCDTPPAVAVTADEGFELAGSGFAELWTKPLHVARVLERIDRLLGEPAIGRSAPGTNPPPQRPRAQMAPFAG